MEKIDKLYEAIDKVRLAFLASDHRGLIFFTSIMLPLEDEEIVERNFANLVSAFDSRPERLPLVHSVVEDLRYLRKCFLSDSCAKDVLLKVTAEIAEEAGSHKAVRDIIK